MVFFGGRQMKEITVTAEQIKAARALLKWKQDDLAKLSGISKPTVARLEKSNDFSKYSFNTINSIIATMRSYGIEFINEDDLTRGVILRNDQL